MAFRDLFSGSKPDTKKMQNIAEDIAVQKKWRKYINASKDQRVIWEAQVAVCESFAAGNHRVGISQDGHFKEMKLLPGQLWRTLNLWPMTLSVITTRLTANDPRWNPRKAQLEDVSDAEIDAADAALQHIWSGSGDSERSVKRELKRAARSAYKQGRRLLYIRFDKELDLPVLDSYPMWDVYSDPSSEELCKKRWLCIVLPKHIDWLEDTYPAAKELDLKGDKRLAESGLQEQYLRSKTGSGKDSKQTIKTIYGFRIVSKDYEEDIDEEVEEPDDTGAMITKKVQKKVKKQKNIILHEVVVETSNGEVSPVIYREEIDYPYLSDIFDSISPRDDEDWHARPPCLDWVDVSKSIDKTYSSIEEYIDMFGQGKWIITRKGLQVPVGGQHGQKIYANPGDIAQLPMSPLPATHFQQFNNAVNQYQQVTGVHGTSLGAMPSGDTSGKALAQASALDEQNSSDDVENFKMCLERVAVKMLRLMADNWDEVHEIYRYDQKTGTNQKIKVIGASHYSPDTGDGEAYDGQEEDPKDPVVMIRPFKRIDVEIVVGPFFKSVHKQEMLVQILNTGWQPGMNPVLDRVILDTIDVGVGREMVRELAKLRNPQLMIAEGKALLIAEGETVPVTRSDPHQFLKDFYAKKATEALKNGDQRTASLFNAQAQKHAILMHKGMGDAGTPEVPQSLEEFMRSQGGAPAEQQGNAAPELPPQLDQAAQAMGGAAPPIPGMTV